MRFGLGFFKGLSVVMNIFVLIGLFALEWFLFSATGMITGNNVDPINIGNAAETAIVLGFVTFMTTIQIVYAIVVISFTIKSTNEEYLANRYVLMLLSFGIGDIMTPFILSGVGNMSSQSTKSPRYFLAKVYSITSLVGSAALLAMYLLTVKNLSTNGLDDLFIDSTSKVISILTITFSVIGMIYGLFSTIAFFSPKSAEKYETSGLLKALGFMSAIWGTVAAILMIINAILSIVTNILKLFESFSRAENGFEIALNFLIAIPMTIFRVLYQIFVIRMLSEVIKGLYSHEDKIVLTEYAALSEKQAQMKR